MFGTFGIAVAQHKAAKERAEKERGRVMRALMNRPVECDADGYRAFRDAILQQQSTPRAPQSIIVASDDHAFASFQARMEISLALSMLESETGCEAYYTGRWTSDGPVVGYWGKTSVPPVARRHHI